jgi:ABC-2 type transport system permease protein
MSRAFRILRLVARLQAQFELAYRVNFLFDVLQQLVVTVTSVGAVFILYSYTDQLNGWTLAAMIVLIGVFYVVQGAGDLMFMPSAQQFIEQVRLGTLDFVLLKPVDAQFFVSVWRINFTSLAEIAMGVVIVIAGFVQLGTLDLLAAVAFVATLLCGLLLIYVVLSVLATLAFWFVRVQNLLVLYEAFTDAARFPIDIYPFWLRVTMSSVIPIGVAVTVPAQAVAGRLEPLGVAVLFAATAAAVAFSRWFWKVGLRSYTGASA